MSEIETVESTSGRGITVCTFTYTMTITDNDLLKNVAQIAIRQVVWNLCISRGSAYKFWEKKAGVRRIAAR